MLHPFIPPARLTLATPDLFTVPVAVPLPECDRAGITQYGTTLDWLLSLTKMYLRFFLGPRAHFFVAE